MPRRPSIKKKVKPLTDDELGKDSETNWDCAAGRTRKSSHNLRLIKLIFKIFQNPFPDSEQISSVFHQYETGEEPH